MMEGAKEDPVIVFSTDCHHPIIIPAKEPDVQPRAKLCHSPCKQKPKGGTLTEIRDVKACVDLCALTSALRHNNIG